MSATDSTLSRTEDLPHMRTIFPIFLFTSLIIFGATGAVADAGDRPHPPRPVELAQELGLDAAKTAVFVQILEDQRTRHRALREQATQDRRQMHEELEALRAETKARLAGVLDPQQLQRFDAIRPPPPRRFDGDGDGDDGERPHRYGQAPRR